VEARQGVNCSRLTIAILSWAMTEASRVKPLGLSNLVGRLMKNEVNNLAA
jgi:hypothetical protein